MYSICAISIVISQSNKQTAYTVRPTGASAGNEVESGFKTQAAAWARIEEIQTLKDVGRDRRDRALESMLDNISGL